MKAVAAIVLVAALAAPAVLASAGPVGPIPKGAVSTISATKGELISVALPSSSAGGWRLARALNPKVVTEVTEGNLGTSVVIVFRAVGAGDVKIVYALTKGESATALKSKTFVVHISS